MKTRSSFRSQKKQARLAFQPLPPSSLEQDAYPSSIKSRLANVRVEGRSPLRRPVRASANDSTIPTPESSSQVLNVNASTSPLKDPPTSPATSLPRSSPTDAHKSVDGKFDGDDDLDDEDDAVMPPSSKRRRLLGRTDGKEDVSTGRPTRRAQSTRRIQSSPLRRIGRRPQATRSSPIRMLSDIGSAESSDDDARQLRSSPAPSRNRERRTTQQPVSISHTKNTQPARRKRISVAYDETEINEADFIVDDDEVEYISSGSEAVVRAPRSSNKHRKRSRQVQDELDDDLLDLKDSDSSEEDLERTRGGIVNTKFQKTREHLKRLKRRRAGHRSPQELDSENDNHQFEELDGADLEDIDERPLLGRPIVTDDDESDGPQEVLMQDFDAAEEDFVVDDDDAETHNIGIDRPHPDMPIAFTSFATRKPKDLFVYVIEWLVKNRIAPAFSRDDELYDLSWNKLNDQIKAQAGSRLISSAWHEDFKWTIMARPHMSVHLVGDGEDESFLNCDACNRTNHPARYEFKFSGHAYDKDTLESIEEDSDKEVDDSASYDQAGHLLQAESTLFYLGRFCAANAEMGHKLTHWKYQLNASLLEYLEEQGALSADAIVAREKLNKKKREKEAENIVDSMEATGVIAQLWQNLQDDMDDARYGMEGHEKKGGRRKNRIGKVRVKKGSGVIEEWAENGRRRIVIEDDSDNN